MARIPIALQLYSIREDAARDLAGTLKAVADMGYEGVEFAGYYDHTATDIKKLLDDVGLKCAGTHTGFPTLQGDELRRTVEFNQTIGNKYLIVPWIGNEYRGSREAFEKFGRDLGAAASKAPDMVLGYHNHDFEFTPLEDGTLPLDAIYGVAPPEVSLQLDIGNAMHGGGDPMPFLERYAGRNKTVHLKEYSATNPKALVGEGDVDWQRVFELCESSAATEWYIVEQESYAASPLESVAKCLQNLKEMGK